ncbi:hypothetical protein CXF67_05485 [Psychroflexus sp. MES1-P1E]|nr:hypothetical protein CXF67_05485 [Psychroflexus sp. MES1-P1E]
MIFFDGYFGIEIYVFGKVYITEKVFFKWTAVLENFNIYLLMGFKVNKPHKKINGFVKNGLFFHATVVAKLYPYKNQTMKKVILTALAICTLSIGQAQDENLTDSQERMEKFNEVKKHEISLDVAAAISGLGINPRYEYVLGRYSGIGVDLNIGTYDNSNNENIETFSFTPYYRQYFFSKEDYGAKGFYGEGFVKLYSFDNDSDLFFNNNSLPKKSFTELAIGAGIGWKWVSDSGFLIDVGFGIGRNLGIADDDNLYNLPELTGRGGVNFGWRF